MGIGQEKEEQETRENSSVGKLARAEHKEDSKKKAGSPHCQPVTDMVETMGIEPTTSGLQSPRSPN